MSMCSINQVWCSLSCHTLFRDGAVDKGCIYSGNKAF